MTAYPLETVAAGQDRFTALRNHGGALLRGVPVLNQSGWHDSGLTDGVTLGGTTRLKYVAIRDCTDLRIVYVNGYNRSEGPNDITVSAAIEGPMLVGWNKPILAKATWNGKTSVVVNPGGIAISDPIGFDLTAGGTCYIRTFATVASTGMTMPKGSGVDTTQGESVVYSASSPVDYTTFDAQHLGEIMPSTGGAGFGPICVIGTVCPTAAPGRNASPILPVIGGMGDSIMSGSGDTYSPRPASGVGFVRRALNNQFPFLCLAASGELAASMQQSATQWGRQLRAMLLDGCTHAIVEYATNDLTPGASLATIQSRLLEIWTSLSRRGIAVYQTTIAPRTTSTDSWATTVNQTHSLANEADRVLLNDWIRTTPSPLTGYFEIADLAESARNSGIWKAGYTGDGTHPNATGHAALAAGVDTSVFVVA